MFAILRCQRMRLRCPSQGADTIHWEFRTACSGVSVMAVQADGDEKQLSVLSSQFSVGAKGQEPWNRVFRKPRSVGAPGNSPDVWR